MWCNVINQNGLCTIHQLWSGITYTMSLTLYTSYSIMDAGEVNATMPFIQPLADALRFEALSFRIML